MTFIERATETAKSVADGAIATVGAIGTAVAEGVVVISDDIKDGIKAGHIRPGTVVATASIGLIAVLEWPVLVAVGGVALLAAKLKNRQTEAPQSRQTEAPQP